MTEGHQKEYEDESNYENVWEAKARLEKELDDLREQAACEALALRVEIASLQVTKFKLSII